MTTAEAIAVLVGTVALVVAAGRWRRAASSASLAGGERLRPLALLAIEPVIYVVLVAGLLADELSESAAHLVAVLVGAAGGAFLGRYRARIMYVRADAARRAIVVRRSAAEYAALAVLVVLEIGRGQLQDKADRLDHPLSLLLTALIGFALSEALVRIGIMAARYRREIAGGG